MNVSAVAAEYLAIRTRAGKAANTLRVDATLLPRFAAHLDDPDFAELTKDKVASFFYGTGGIMDAHVTSTKGQEYRVAVQPSTHNHYRARLSVFLRWAKDNGYTALGNLLADVDPMKEPKKRRLQPSPNLLLEFLDAAECARDRAYLAVALNTACRASELTAIRVGDVDLDRGTVFVTIIKTKEEDEMPITSDLDRELRAWLVAYSELLGRPLREDDCLFPARTGNTIKTHYFDAELGQRVYERTPFVYHPDKPITRTEGIVKGALEKLGLPTRYQGTHTVRRAVSRAYFDMLSESLGYDAALRTVSALLHHANMSTTERYLGLSSERARRDATLQGQPFLSAMVSQENVVPLRRAQ